MLLTSGCWGCCLASPSSSLGDTASSLHYSIASAPVVPLRVISATPCSLKKHHDSIEMILLTLCCCVGESVALSPSRSLARLSDVARKPCRQMKHIITQMINPPHATKHLNINPQTDFKVALPSAFSFTFQRNAIARPASSAYLTSSLIDSTICRLNSSRQWGHKHHALCI